MKIWDHFRRDNVGFKKIHFFEFVFCDVTTHEVQTQNCFSKIHSTFENLNHQFLSIKHCHGERGVLIVLGFLPHF